MKIYKQKDSIIFEFPYEQDRFNPYMEEESEQGLLGKYYTFVGIIEDWPKNYICSSPKMGFAYTIDMDYKDKPDQFTDIVIEWQGEEKDFRQICKDLKITLVDLRKRSAI